MKLYHYSNRIIPKVWQINYPEHNVLADKPFGFWASVGASWKTWCKNQEFYLENLRFCHRVYLHRKHGCLIIETEKQLFDFVENYGFSNFQIIYKEPKEMGLYFEFPEKCEKMFNTKDCIDWVKIQKKYKGIIFKNYLKHSIFSNYCIVNNLTWYYSLDCASGCIWDTSAIKEIRVLP